jgi:DNA primase
MIPRKGGRVADRAADDRKEAVRRATDLVALVQRYLPLRRSGASFKALCPFHQERTPSFSVWPQSQRWKCFSCGRSGDAFSFVMEKEGVEFPEALRMLAREAGVELGRPDPAAAAASRAKEAAYAACEWACRWFQGNLRGSPAAEYLKGRGLTGETAREWRLGYAPDSWDALLRAADRDGIPLAALEAAGLVLPRKTGDGSYDRFRHRAIFPIADPQGRVVGFGARALGDEEPKYLNTPETVLFQKGRLLFGLDRAREEAMRLRSLEVMEGYTDAIMAHQHGFRTAVAGLGTAFTPDHAALMRRFADRVVLVFDSDAAGDRATERAVHVLFEAGLDCRVAVVAGGKDPCELLVARGPAPLREALDGATEVFDHVIARALRTHDLATIGGRAAAADEVLGFAIRVHDDVRRSLMLDRVSASTGLSEERVRARAKALIAASLPRAAAPADAGPVRARSAAPPEAPGAAVRRERLLLEAALAGPGLAARLAAEAPPGTFATPSLARIAAAAVATARGGDGDPAACAASLGDEVLADAVAELAAAGAGKPADALLRQFEDCLGAHSLDRRIEEARSRFAEARTRGAPGEEDRWLAELQRLQSERKRPARTPKR